MDFNYRSDEFKPLSSGERSYITEQAMRAAILRTDIEEFARGGGDVFGGSDPMREAILRELEKERIREEIIATEIQRKRDLEMEVRRELAMERELLIQRANGFLSMAGTTSVPSTWSDSRTGTRSEGVMFDRMPLQWPRVVQARAPEVNVGGGSVETMPGGKKVVFLAKSTGPSLAGKKRNAAVAMIGSSNKKVQKEWNCALCQVTATSEQDLNEHFRGKKHKAKLGNLQASKVADSSTSSSTPLAKTAGKVLKSPQFKKIGESPVQKKANVDEPKQKKFKFWCQDCRVGCNSLTVMDSHRSGKKHQANLQKVNGNGGTVLVTKENATRGPTDEANRGDEKLKEEATTGADKNEVESLEAAGATDDIVSEEVEEEEQVEAQEEVGDDQDEVIDRLTAVETEQAPVEGSAEMKEN